MRTVLPTGALPRKYAGLALATSLAAIGAVVCEYASTSDVPESLEAFCAVLVAGAIAALAISLPGITVPGLAFGGFFVGAGILSWSYSDRPIVVWSLLAVEGVVFAVWSRPWLRHLRRSPRLGGAWLGVSYWLLGIVSAGLVLHAGVAAQRLLYAGVFGLAVLAVLAVVPVPPAGDSAGPAVVPAGDRPGPDASAADAAPPDPSVGPDPSIGIAAAFLLAIAALVVSGSGNLFDSHHVVVAGPWGEKMDYRFWGGPWLLYHPNSLAGIGVAAAIRIGVDRRFAVWQRLAATVLAGCVVYVTNSRTGFVFLTAAGVAHAGLLLWRRRRPAGPDRLTDLAGLPEYAGRRALAAAVTPFVVLALIFAVSGGTSGFLLKSRYGDGGGDVTSGRTATWKQVGEDWLDAGLAEKLFGDAGTVRAVVIRESSGRDVELTTDNAAVGALRRGGVFGLLAFLFGLCLLLYNAARRGSSAWFVVAALAAIPTIATADWLLGGTGGTLWILLVAGEVIAVRAALNHSR